jgi:putative ABC transport system permease protein
MPSLANQLKQVFRRLGRAPLFTAITLLTLAVGIGSNSAIFSVINGVLLKPLPYSDPDRLVAISHSAPGLGFPRLDMSPAIYYTYREESRVFEQVGAWRRDSVNITGVAEPEQVDAFFVTYDILPMLRVNPLIGRTFDQKDDSPASPETTVLTYAYWQRKFGGDPSAIGKRIVVEGKATDIIGVLPQDFKFRNMHPSMVLPLRFDRAKTFVGNFSYQGIARLKPGITLAQTNADVARMLPMQMDKFTMPPGFTREMFRQALIGPNLHFLKDDVIGDIGKVLWVLMATVGIVLLIACANVANLFLVRAEGRQQEFAIRAALGAGSSQMSSDLLSESITLGIIGGILGAGLAYAGIRLLVSLGPSDIPRLSEITMDPLVLLFTFGISLVAGVLFGLLPVFKFSATALGTALREGGRALSDGRERLRARNVLVVVQVALALVLLISSGLMIRTFQALRNVRPGFTHPEDVLTLRVSIPEALIPSPQQTVRMHQQIAEKIQQMPGVTSVGLTTSVTMDGSNSNDPLFLEDFPPPEGQIPPMHRMKWVGPGYFHAMGNPLIAGRDLTWEDAYNALPVGVISEGFARKYWKDPAKAIGSRLRESPKDDWRQIVGVVGDDRDDGVDQPAPETIYWPPIQKNFWAQPISVRRDLAYVIRGPRTGSATFVKEVRQAVWSVNPSLPVAGVQTLQEIYSQSMARTSFTLLMLAIAASMALLLGVVGIYGVISYSVSQRTREIGIRMALGAQRQDVSQMFLRHGLVLSGIGIVLGIGVALGLTRLMSSLLFEVSPFDPLTFAAVPLGLILASMLASYLPARKATTVDPVQALRAD